jgi:hypothetical protein
MRRSMRQFTSVGYDNIASCEFYYGINEKIIV